MRFYKPTKESMVGKRRTISKFAVLPVSIRRDDDNTIETRWMERVRLEQEYVSSPGGLCEGTLYYWINIKFVE